MASKCSAPLQLFTHHVDSSLPEDSCIQLVHDDTSQPEPPARPGTSLISPPTPDGEGNSPSESYALNQIVLQIQSPTIRTTYIQCPPNGPHMPGLGLKHPWLHIQVRDIGKAWAFEVGLVDVAGRMGILRLSTFQKQPRLRLSSDPSTSYPLLHFPLAFPSPSTRPLTAWATVTLHLPSYLPHFSCPKLLDSQSAASSNVPSGKYAHVAYVRVYATCRLRRVWFSEGGPAQKAPWEFELYGAT
ncbi:hypothetical protein H0H81_002619 [Sphagnurus paluster]|uniref:CFA20 domain-containing protein n=1 Tax=Sphagnurus paluster TaxID=117069 RepID=A0A9P7GW11_9AGAR|nr:hypothetical protein H0H81_002619 [Sphagnurus paluster]